MYLKKGKEVVSLPSLSSNPKKRRDRFCVMGCD